MSFNIPFSPTNTPNPLLGPLGMTLRRGDISPQLQLQRVKFDPVRGFAYVYNWKGASQSQMLALAQECINAGMVTECSFERDMGVLDVSDSTSELTIDSWEIHASEETRDLFSMPELTAAVADVVAEPEPARGQAMADIFSAIRTHLANDDPWATVSADAKLTAVLADATAGPLITDYYAVYKQGTTGYRRQAYVLKHKTNVSNRWAVNVADEGIDLVYTTAQLMSEVTNPALWVFPLPERLQYKLSVIPSLAGPSEYLWGWLKSSSTETTDALNRVTIETDYTLDLWDTNIYYYLL